MKSDNIKLSELRHMYICEYLSMPQIAKKLGVSYSTVWRLLHRYSIPIRGRGDAHRGKVVSEETRLKISESSKGNTKWLGKRHSSATKKKIQKHRLGSTASTETKEKMSQSHLERWQDPTLKKRVSKAHKRNWQDPEYRDKVVRNTLSALSIHPNKPETIVLNILNQIAPSNWEFTGDGKVVLGGKSPDFYNVNGQKKIIEVFGDYWHGERARCYEETEEGRIAHFKIYGHDTLVIWEHELEDGELVKEKIARFVGKEKQEAIENV